MALIFSFCSVRQLVVLYLPLDGILVHPRSTPQGYPPVPIYTLGIERHYVSIEQNSTPDNEIGDQRTNKPRVFHTALN